MILYVVLAILLIILFVARQRWALARRRDARSIASHRSKLGVIEHVSGADEIAEAERPHATEHVRVVSGSVPVSPRVRPEPPNVRPSPPLLTSYSKVPLSRDPSAGGTVPAAGRQVPAWQVTERPATRHRAPSAPPTLPPAWSEPAVRVARPDDAAGTPAADAPPAAVGPPEESTAGDLREESTAGIPPDEPPRHEERPTLVFVDEALGGGTPAGDAPVAEQTTARAAAAAAALAESLAESHRSASSGRSGSPDRSTSSRRSKGPRRPAGSRRRTARQKARGEGAGASRGSGGKGPRPGGPDHGGPAGHRGGFQVRAAVAAAVAAVVVAGAAYGLDHLASSGSGHTTPKAQAAPSTTTPHATRRTSPSTAPAPAVTSDARSSTYADYTVAANAINVSLVVTQRCWVEVRDGSESGATTYEGILNPGVSQNFQANGGLWIRLGDPVGVQMSIDGAPVPLPHYPAPFNVAVSGSTGT